METLTNYLSTARAVVSGGPAIHTHPVFAALSPTWRKLGDCYTGRGGFADGSYIVPHVREYLDYTSPTPSQPSPKLIARRRLARYENLAELVVDQKLAALGRVPPTRQVTTSTAAPHPIVAWWQDVDGLGTQIDDYLIEHWLGAAIYGHINILADRPAGPRPATKAEEAPIYLAAYAPGSTMDWAFDTRGRLTGMRFVEAPPRPSIEHPVPDAGHVRSRIVTATSFKVIDGQSTLSQGTHGFGCVPIVQLFSRRDPFVLGIGRSVLGDPKRFIDDYNLTSELRELLRAQTFGQLNIPLGTNGAFSAEAVRNMNDGSSGTGNVLLTPEPARYISPDTGNVTAYQEERRQLRREILRGASVPYETDSRDAESADALELKREDMNLILAGYADEMERADYGIAQLWFRAEYGPDRWQQEWDAAKVVIKYPDTFNVTPFAAILEQAQAALSLEMPDTFTRELKKRLVGQFLPDLPEKTLKAITAELDQPAAATDPAADIVERARARLAGLSAA